MIQINIFPDGLKPPTRDINGEPPTASSMILEAQSLKVHLDWGVVWAIIGDMQKLDTCDT